MGPAISKHVEACAEKGQKRARKGGKDLVIVSTRGDLASACLPVRMPRSKSRLHRRVACFSSSSSSSAKSILSSLYFFHFPRCLLKIQLEIELLDSIDQVYHYCYIV